MSYIKISVFGDATQSSLAGVYQLFAILLSLHGRRELSKSKMKAAGFSETSVPL